MKQQAELGLNLSPRRTRKAVFLDEMALVVKWREPIALIASASPVPSTGRPPVAYETMLGIHPLQDWFSLSDLAMEEADVFADSCCQGVALREEMQGIEENLPLAMLHCKRKTLDKATSMGAERGGDLS